MNGVQPLVTYVPGSGATELARSVDALHSFHEEIAYNLAMGAAMAGRPSFCLIKSHGVAKAMNAVIASLYAGVSAPFMVLVFDDATGKTSDHPFEARKMLEAVGASVFAELAAAIEHSKSYRVPAFVCTEGVPFSLPATMGANFTAIKKRESLLNPLLSDWQESRMKARRKAIQEGQRFEFSVAAPMTQVPADLPPHLKGTAQKYEPWVRAFSKTGFDFVAGDAGTSSLFGMAPFEWVDVCTNMGGSIPLASGASLAGRKALAVTGDFSFLSMGPLALLEAQRRALSLKVIVFCNQEAAATGGQGVNRDWVRASIPDGIIVMDFEGSPDPDSITQFANMTGLAVGLIHA